MNGLARNRINRELITRNWDDSLRMASSLNMGTVGAVELIRSLQGGSRASRLGEALAEQGRIPKTVNLLTFFDDEAHRRFIRPSSRGTRAATRSRARRSTRQPRTRPTGYRLYGVSIATERRNVDVPHRSVGIALTKGVTVHQWDLWNTTLLNCSRLNNWPPGSCPTAAVGHPCRSRRDTCRPGSPAAATAASRMSWRRCRSAGHPQW
jgi:hypothetical protein